MRPHYSKFNSTQSAIKLDRKIVTPADYKSFGDKLKSKLGQARASFARTTRELLPSKKIKPFVEKQIDSTISNGKSVFDGSQLSDSQNPSIMFGSHAIGVVSNPMVADKISGAIKSRQKKVFDKLKKVINGYAYDFKTGGVFKKKEITASEQ
jgi:hypothetical protein